jgi:5-methylcytosine-specific restriction endonuclease McrA
VLSNDLLYARDRHVCAYCGGRFAARELSCDHVNPVSKSGRHVWMNVVTACRTCNGRKANRTPEQARMPLLYVPYTPSRHEHFILRNRDILVDQMEYLLAGVPRTSRLHA